MNAILVRIGDAFTGLFGGIINIWETEPVAVTGLITVLLDAAVAFGAPIDDGQKTAVVGVVSAVGVLIARSNVTPTAAPSLPSGTRVNVETAAGVPDKTVVLPQ
jgi:hypothetical protein